MRSDRREELKRLAATPHGTDKLYQVLSRGIIAFERLPNGTSMIEAIPGHKFADASPTATSSRATPGAA